MGCTVEFLGYRPSCILFFAVGGGGDPASAALLARVAAERWGVRSVLASNAWERLARDPNPGPVPLYCLEGVEPLGPTAARVLAGCRAVREGAVFEPSACAAARVAGLPAYIVDYYRGSLGAARALEEIASLHGCEAIVAVDVGGDVLARGCEEGLWSPLSDSLGLAAAVETGLDAVLAVHSPGADGELPQETVLEYIAELSAQGAYLWARGLSAADIPLLEELVEATGTEAGRVALLAAKGYHGVYRIRGGSRAVRVTPVNTLTYMLDARKASETALARHARGTASLEEARRRLNSLGVYTELDLEEDMRLLSAPDKPQPSHAAEARRRGRRRLGGCKAGPAGGKG